MGSLLCAFYGMLLGLTAAQTIQEGTAAFAATLLINFPFQAGQPRFGGAGAGIGT